MMQQPGSNGFTPAPQQPWMMQPQQQQQQQQQQPVMWQNQGGPLVQQIRPPLGSVAPQYQYQNQSGQQASGGDEVKTLWIGDLQPWMDETYLQTCFNQGEVISVKVIRNKLTGHSESYGFIEFVTRAAAENVLQTLNGQLMPNVEQTFRLNWATFGVGEKRPDNSADFTIFVGDLASDVTDYLLQETFKSQYTSVKGAKVVTDRATGRTKGYGFVRFGDEVEQLRALNEMNGMFCSSRQMRVGLAASKQNMVGQQQYTKAPYQNTESLQSEGDPNNTTIFVGAVDPTVTEDMLRQLFGQYGELNHVKIPLNKRCAFVQFANRGCAEQALLLLNGYQLAGQSIRLSWGRNPASKLDSSVVAAQPQSQPDSNQWNGGGYPPYGYNGYNQGYPPYGYAPPPQTSNMFTYGAYPNYPNYPQTQQQQPQQQ